MINARELLDAMVNANATRHNPDAPNTAQRGFLQDALEAFGSGSRAGAGGILGQVLGQATGGLADMARHPNAREAMGGQSVEDLARRAQEMMGRNPESPRRRWSERRGSCSERAAVAELLEISPSWAGSR